MKELKLTKSDIKKIKAKNKNKSIFTVVFLLLTCFALYWFSQKDAINYYILIGSTIVFLGTLSHLIYLYNLLRKDLNSNLKIVSNAIVLEKKMDINTSDTNNPSIPSCYIITNNPLVERYSVFEKDYVRINVGDPLIIEYTKFGNFILRIECNNINIENNSNFK